MIALYELAEARTILHQWVEEYEGEWTPEMEALMTQLAVDRDTKIERIGLFVRERKVYIDAVKQERERLDAIVRQNTRAVEALLIYLQRNMQAMDVTTVKGKLCTVAIQKNAAPTISCTIEAKDLPGELRREVLTYSLDRDAVLKQWQDGALPKGIDVQQGSHIRIR